MAHQKDNIVFGEKNKHPRKKNVREIHVESMSGSDIVSTLELRYSYIISTLDFYVEFTSRLLF